MVSLVFHQVEVCNFSYMLMLMHISVTVVIVWSRWRNLWMGQLQDRVSVWE